MNIFQQRLKSAMNLRQINQTELSKITGITKASISQYVNGVYEAKQNNLFLLAQALNCSPAYLMGLEDEPDRSGTDVRRSDADLQQLQEDEKDLVSDYRKLNPTGKDKVREYAKDLSENERYSDNLWGKLKRQGNRLIVPATVWKGKE